MTAGGLTTAGRQTTGVGQTKKKSLISGNLILFNQLILII
jgi:hypothetical protein